MRSSSPASTSPSSSSFTDASGATPTSTSTAAFPPPPSDDEESSLCYCEVRSTHDRGQALFSTRRIRPGTLIFTEEPLISISKELEESYAAIEAAFAALSRRERKTYLCLFDAKKSRMSTVVSIYYSNCYSTESFVSSSDANTNANSSENGSCIGALSSRINHSCIPNVSFSFQAPSPKHPRGQMRFYAIRAIAHGKELLSNYDKSIFETAARRQQKYLLHYGFRCACEACVGPTEFWAKSDERRRAMRGAVAEVRGLERTWLKAVRVNGGAAGAVGQGAGEEAVAALLKLEGLLVKEGLTAMPLANAYRSFAKWADRCGLDAGKWKAKELEVSRLVFGKGAPRSVALRADLVGSAVHE